MYTRSPHKKRDSPSIHYNVFAKITIKKGKDKHKRSDSYLFFRRGCRSGKEKFVE